jgi:tRNA 2-thiouridine synthesizing protein E
MMTIEFDEEGYLRHLDDWSAQIAQQVAANEGIVLGEAHWEIITVIREFYETYQLSPAMRPLVKAISLKLGKDKGKSIYLLQLFPGSPAKVISKIAGLPKPDNCL